MRQAAEAALFAGRSKYQEKKKLKIKIHWIYTQKILRFFTKLRAAIIFEIPKINQQNQIFNINIWRLKFVWKHSAIVCAAICIFSPFYFPFFYFNILSNFFFLAFFFFAFRNSKDSFFLNKHMLTRTYKLFNMLKKRN